MRIRRIATTLVIAGLTTAGAVAVAGNDVAGAASSSIPVVCKQNPVITVEETLATFTVNYTAPSEVEAGSTFDISGISVPFTNTQTLALTFGPWHGQFDVSGGATPSSFSGSAPAVTLAVGASTNIGPFSKSITAPASPGEIEIELDHVMFPVSLDGGVTTLTTVTCDPTGSSTVATISVVSPPPPGAPNANPDSAEVKPGESVNIDVLANDTNPEVLRADLGAVTAPEIMDAPVEGTAEVEEDGSVTYTADAGTSATSDSFDYRICTEFEAPEAAFGRAFRPRGEQLPCDTTTVSINIIQPQATTVPPTTTEPTQGTTASSVSPTTDELPVTGSSSTPLGVLGFAVALVGLGLLAVSRRHSTAR